MIRIVCFIIAVLPTMSLFGQEVAVDLKVLEIVRNDWNERQSQSPESQSDGSINRASIAAHVPEAVAQSLERSPASTLVHRLRFDVSDGKPAQVRFASRAPQGKTSVEVGMVFELTPKIFANGGMDIDMKANIEIRRDGAPPFSTQPVKQIVHVSEGERIVLGGFVNDGETRLLTAIPSLENNPMLRYLFSEKRGQREESEIVLMVSPRIVQSLPISRNVVQPNPNIVPVTPAPETRSARIVESPPIRKQEPAVPKTDRALYTVQVAAFDKPAAAESMVVRLKMRYHVVFIEQVAGERTVYRVRVGRVADVKDARELKRQLREKGFQPFIAALNE